MTSSKNLKSKKIKRGGDGSRTGSGRVSSSSGLSRSRSSSRRRSIRRSRSSSRRINSLNRLNRTQLVDTTSLRERIIESQKFYKKFVTRLDRKMTVGDLLKKIKEVAKEVYKKDFSPEQIDRFTKFKYDELLPVLTFM